MTANTREREKNEQGGREMRGKEDQREEKRGKRQSSVNKFLKEERKKKTDSNLRFILILFFGVTFPAVSTRARGV